MESFNHFTVIQLRDASIKNSHDDIDSHQTRKFNYRTHDNVTLSG